MGLALQQGFTASGGSVVTDSQQPTTDQTEVVTTGLSGCRFVEIWFAFTHNNAGSTTYTVQGRVSGGTWRDIQSFSSLGDATSSVGGYVTICNFNQAEEKQAGFLLRSSGSVLDDSSASNALTGGGSSGVAFVAFSEVWDEVKLVSASAGTIEGDTADQRGRWYVAGRT